MASAFPESTFPNLAAISNACSVILSSYLSGPQKRIYKGSVQIFSIVKTHVVFLLQAIFWGSSIKYIAKYTQVIPAKSSACIPISPHTY